MKIILCFIIIELLLEIALSSEINTYNEFVNDIEFEKVINVSCEDNNNNKCFPLIIYSNITSKKTNDIVFTMRLQNYSFSETNKDSVIKGDESLKYEATYIDDTIMSDPKNFNFSSLNYTLKSNDSSIRNNTALKFAMITFKSSEMEKLSGSSQYIVIKITNPLLSTNILKSFHLNTFSYVKPSNYSKITNIPESNYFFWLLPNNIATQSLQLQINENVNYLYVELIPQITISPNRSITFSEISNNNDNNQSSIKIYNYSDNVYGKSFYYLEFEKNNSNYINMTISNINKNKLSQNENDNILYMLKYQTFSNKPNENIIQWKIDKVNIKNTKTETTIIFPTITKENGDTFKKVIYTCRIYQNSTLNRIVNKYYLPVNYEEKTIHSYTKVFDTYVNAQSEMKFYLDRGVYVYDIMAYIEDENIVEFMVSDIYKYEAIYSEWGPIILLGSIVFGLLIISGGYYGFMKIKERKNLKDNSEHFSQIQSMDGEILS